MVVLHDGQLPSAGKLFPGPHLYAGAGIVALWAVAASLVPAMQKGNDGARTLHITLNCINIGLFAWQVTHRQPCTQCTRFIYLAKCSN
jgi:hypothetical protein